MGAVDTVIPLFLLDTCHVSAAESGLIFGALALAYTGAAYWLTTWLVGAVGIIHTMVLGAVAMGMVMPVMALRELCALWAQMLVMIPIGTSLYCFGSAPYFPALFSRGMKRLASPKRQGVKAKRQRSPWGIERHIDREGHPVTRVMYIISSPRSEAKFCAADSRACNTRTNKVSHGQCATPVPQQEQAENPLNLCSEGPKSCRFALTVHQRTADHLLR